MKIDFIIDEGLKKEDNCLIGKNIFAVFDGANSNEKYMDKNGLTGGAIAANIAKEEFHKNKDSLKSMAIAANNKLRRKMLKAEIDLKNKQALWITTAAVIRVNKNRFEWLQIGDSIILIIYKDNSFKLLVKDYDHDKENMVLWKKLANKQQKNIREILDKEIKELRSRSNIDYGYISGEPEFVNFIKQGAESLNNVKHIMLFTDGLFLPKEDPSEPDDWKIFVKLFKEKGLVGLKDYVRNIEKTDPNCWKYPRYKKHDDIAAIAISF